MKNLYDLPQMSPLRIQLADGTMADATFHHIDGSYSYCTIDDDGPNNVFHLRAWTPMHLVDGRWEIAERDTNDEAPNSTSGPE